MLTRGSRLESIVSGLLTTDPALDADRLRERVFGENFPVALRLLPKGIREDLLAVYATARLIDEAGDASRGDRIALLDEIERDLDAAFEGRAEHPVFRALTRTLARRALEKDAFLRLIEANRFDQNDIDLETWEDLRRYCSLSASPIGELVLQLFDQSTPERIRLSNQVCCALQVIEHCQDVGEDFRARRIYLPRSDREEAGCADADLGAMPGSPALRRLVRSEVARAQTLLDSGRRLCADLRGSARIAVAGFVAGGMATCDAFARSEFDPNAGSIERRRFDVGRHFARLYLAFPRKDTPSR